MGALDRLELGDQQLSLQAKRRELISNIVEGRAVIATLVDRHAAMGRKIEEATSGLRRLESQLSAINTVISTLEDERGPVLAAPPRRPPLRAVAVEVPRPQPASPPRPATPKPFKPLAYMRCLSEGHIFTHSRSLSGRITCSRCRYRRRV